METKLSPIGAIHKQGAEIRKRISPLLERLSHFDKMNSFDSELAVKFLLFTNVVQLSVTQRLGALDD